MRRPSNWKWKAIATIGLLIVAGAFAICQQAPGCFLTWESRERTDQSPFSLEKKACPLRTKNRQSHMPMKQVLQKWCWHRMYRCWSTSMPSGAGLVADWRRSWRSWPQKTRRLESSKSMWTTVPDLAGEYRIESIPSLKVFNNGVVTAELVGLASKNQLQALLSR